MPTTPQKPAPIAEPEPLFPDPEDPVESEKAIENIEEVGEPFDGNFA